LKKKFEAMKAIILVLALVAIVSAISIKPEDAEAASQFAAFIKEYNKVYLADDEEGYRFRVFKANLDIINKHNANADAHGFTLGVNAFADLTNSEFREKYLSKFNKTSTGAKHVPQVQVDALPATVDWRTKGAVTPVKDQGQCGSCWSFSATGSIEGAWFLKKGSLVSLSEQNLCDCSTAEGNNGCGGGLMDYAFDYVISNKGIDTEASYPYKAADGRCQFKAANVGATISSYKDVASGSETDLQTAVVQQPISVAIDASHNSFQLYKSGIYYEASCSSSHLDHGVLAVGYGTDSGKDYWLVKNSWAASWGDKGYIKMTRNKNNNCGIATAASYPVV